MEEFFDHKSRFLKGKFCVIPIYLWYNNNRNKLGISRNVEKIVLECILGALSFIKKLQISGNFPRIHRFVFSGR